MRNKENNMFHTPIFCANPCAPPLGLVTVEPVKQPDAHFPPSLSHHSCSRFRAPYNRAFDRRQHVAHGPRPAWRGRQG
eukprot:2634411-Pyramimonas_sp.AAC.1